MGQEKKSLMADRPNPARRAVSVLVGYAHAAEKLTVHSGKGYTKHAVRNWNQCRIPGDAGMAITPLLEGAMSPCEPRPLNRYICPNPDWRRPTGSASASKHCGT